MKTQLKQILSGLSNFTGLDHRMQFCHQYKNLIFINDSKATNIDSTKHAIETFDNIYLILGGISKDEGIEMVSHLFKKIKKGYLIGDAAENFGKVLDKYKVSFSKCGTLESSLLEIKKDAIDGVVLLSPACSSLDQWKNFEERGNYFVKKVKELWKN